MKLTNKRVDTDSLYEIITLGKDDAHYPDNERIKGSIVKFDTTQKRACNPDQRAYDSPGWYCAWFTIIRLGKNNDYHKVGESACFLRVRLKKIKE